VQGLVGEILERRTLYNKRKIETYKNSLLKRNYNGNYRTKQINYIKNKINIDKKEDKKYNNYRQRK